jgi:antitoxin component YwqK of YwqJK toxin-antitoxin module
VYSRKNYKEGELDGLSEKFDSNGQLEERVLYKDGKTVDIEGT